MTTPQNPTRKKFTLHVFPHVKRFLEKKHHPSAIIKVEGHSTLGKFITMALRDARQSNQADYNDNYYRERLTEKITIQLTTEQSRLSPRLHKLMRINIDMDRVFKDHLIEWIEAQKMQGTPAYTSCRMFLEFYQLDEKEYSLENAYKCWQRWSQYKSQ